MVPVESTILTGTDRVVHLISTTVPGTADLDPRADVQGNLMAGSLAALAWHYGYVPREGGG